MPTRNHWGALLDECPGPLEIQPIMADGETVYVVVDARSGEPVFTSGLWLEARVVCNALHRLYAALEA